MEIIKYRIYAGAFPHIYLEAQVFFGDRETQYAYCGFPIDTPSSHMAFRKPFTALEGEEDFYEYLFYLDEKEEELIFAQLNRLWKLQESYKLSTDWKTYSVEYIMGLEDPKPGLYARENALKLFRIDYEKRRDFFGLSDTQADTLLTIALSHAGYYANFNELNSYNADYINSLVKHILSNVVHNCFNRPDIPFSDIVELTRAHMRYSCLTKSTYCWDNYIYVSTEICEDPYDKRNSYYIVMTNNRKKCLRGIHPILENFYVFGRVEYETGSGEIPELEAPPEIYKALTAAGISCKPGEEEEEE